MPTRAIFFTLVGLTTSAALYCYSGVLSENGWNVLEIISLVLFTVLFAWISQGFWTAMFGFVVSIFQASRRRHDVDFSTIGDHALGKTAIVMPVYNEDPSRVIAGLRATIRSLCATERSAAFDVFVLSDTRNTHRWLEEEKAWLWLSNECPDVGVFYRRRPENKSRKSGNISDFCQRWGASYDYMIVLDADSIMDGETLVELVRRMDADPELGILQVPPKPVNRLSLFARLQQFAASVYGPVFIRGFSAWTGRDGNYWGHNAIIRIKPFMRYCDLPTLPGEAPLGGEILSHDFVEAALMSRAGFKVELAVDLDGSYEECPTTLVDYAIRDQRWCQGNLQHGRLLVCEGFRPMSRLHFAMGVLSYIAAPLWVMFIATSLGSMAVESGRLSVASQSVAWGLFAVSMAMLMFPKIAGFLIALPSASKSGNRFLGGIRLAFSVIVETCLSILLAPVMALFHSQFVVASLAGHSVRWDTQQRDETGVSWRIAVKQFLPHTMLGAIVIGSVLLVAPSLAWWFVLGFGGLLVSIPVAVVSSSVVVGRLLKSWRLLEIPEEVDPPAVLKEYRVALEQAKETLQQSADRQLFGKIVGDKNEVDLHTHILKETGAVVSASNDDVESLLTIARSNGVDAIPEDKQGVFLADDQALLKLHRLVRN